MRHLAYGAPEPAGGPGSERPEAHLPDRPDFTRRPDRGEFSSTPSRPPSPDPLARIRSLLLDGLGVLYVDREAVRQLVQRALDVAEEGQR